MLAAAALTPLRWVRVFDLGPLPLIQAVVAQHHAWRSSSPTAASSQA